MEGQLAALWKLPHLRGVEDGVAHSHSVLSQGPGLVTRDRIDAAQGLHSLSALDEDILGVHALSSDGQCHRHSGEQTLRDIGDNDSDREDGGSEGIVTWRQTG